MRPDAPREGGRAPLDAAAWVRAAGEGDAARVESLLAAGADPNAALESGETALLRAASKGRLEVVRLLLGAGADPNAEREDGFTPLSVAVFFGHAEVVRALLDGGADPMEKGRLGADSAERWALARGHGEIAELLRSHRRPARAPEYFPADGEFSTVVPLEQLAAGPAGATASEPKEQEVVTIVRPRRRAARVEAGAGAARPRVPRQPWTLTFLLLGLSALAGLAAGTYLLRAGWSAKTHEPAPPAEAASGVTSETSSETSSEVTNHPPEPQPAATEDVEPPAPAAVEDEAAAVASATAPPEAEPKSAASKPAKIERAAEPESGPEPAARPAAAENRRAARAATTSSSAAPATPRAARTPAAEKTAARRAVSEAPRAVSRPAGRAASTRARTNSTPVLAPAPKSAKSKVIPWP